VPYSVAIGGTADVTVSYQGQAFTTPAVPVAGSAPGVFTSTSSGAGPASAVNQNNSINSFTSPAPLGSIISFYITGVGQTNPPGIDGIPASVPLPSPVLPVYVILNGQYVPVTFAGSAPGMLGVTQINARIPANLVQTVTGPVAVPLLVQVGPNFGQSNVTVTVSR
jgi:uncharacterized protein (TIGR03437 family)